MMYIIMVILQFAYRKYFCEFKHRSDVIHGRSGVIHGVEGVAVAKLTTKRFYGDMSINIECLRYVTGR